MDNASIFKLLESQENNFNTRLDKLELYVSGAISLNHANIINELDPIRKGQDHIIEQNVIRNGRMEKSEEDIKCLRRETMFGRWLEKHPLPAALIILAIVMLGALAVDIYRVNVNKTIENATGIVIEPRDADVQ